MNAGNSLVLKRTFPATCERTMPSGGREGTRVVPAELKAGKQGRAV